jgi:hypothetical protein
MLRRPATTIHLTSADLELYEKNRQRKIWEKQHDEAAGNNGSDNSKGKEKETTKLTQKDRILGGGRQGN